MTQHVVDLTLGTIHDLLVQEVKFLSGVEGQVKDVQVELQMLKSFLEEVDRRKSEELPVLNFVKEIKSLCYRIEDVVDTYAAEVVDKKRRKGIKNILERIACSLCEWKSIHEVGIEVAGIKEEISSLTSSIQNYGIMKSSLQRQKLDEDHGRKKWQRRTYGLGVENDFVGMKKDIKLLVAELLNGDVRNHRVVSICGMGGLGKTTLAEKIYHHKDIRRGFEAFAWVCISKDYEPNHIFQDLLVQLIPNKREEANRMGENELVREVHKVLQENKCLVVLDDVWEFKDWKCLQPAFPLDANIKVLITTRKESVAKVGFPHYLGFLSEDEGWKLLQKKAFIRSDCKDLGMEPKALEQLGRQMVRKCGYLPLAISLLGGILSEKKSLDAWESVNKKNIDVNIRGEGSEKEIEGVLSLSYDDLPYRLKPCFLYLSRLPEDHFIQVGVLCLLWIAEGLVSPKDQEKDETLWDVALRYLSDLASRSLLQLQAGEFFVAEDNKSIRIHDLLRELCLKKSMEEEFLYVMDFRGGKRPSTKPSSTSSCSRRLAIYGDRNLDGVSLTAESSQSLRSLLLYVPPNFMVSNSGLFTGPKRVIDFNKLNFLRVLQFVNVNFDGEILPTEISKLIHLKYLGLFSCRLQELPSWIGGLPFLQFLQLDLDGEPKIPNVLWKLKGLKFLSLPMSFVAEEKLVLDGLDELETLDGFNNKTCEITDLSELRNLQRFSAWIYGNENLSKFMDSIEAYVKCLDYTTVTIEDCDFRSEEGMALLKHVFKSSKIHSLMLLAAADAGISKLPDYEPCFFPNLGELYLVGGEISEDPMGTLEKLCNLRKLDIYKSFVGEEMICHANGFPQLRYLELCRLSNLKKWRVEEGAMPCLSYLRVSYCEHLDMIPDGIKSINTLQTLNIGGMPEGFIRRVEEGGEDFDKVCHVNSIVKEDYTDD